jgi:hypothetical protein
MARANTETLLPLDRYAKIIGINPVQFNGGYNTTLFSDTGSTERWRQYPWQDENKSSREEIAGEIAQAEMDILGELGYWPAPRWQENETKQYPRYHRRELTGLRGYRQSGEYKSVNLRTGKWIEGGKRSITKIGTASVAYTDPDSDSFDELATVSIATAITNACELHVFFKDKGASDDTWEIRPHISKSVSGGTFTATFHSWMLFDPDIWEKLYRAPASGSSPLDIDSEDSDNYVTEVDVYRVYNDPEEQCTLLWSGATAFCSSCSGTGCPQCSDVTQVACISVRNDLDSLVMPIPATYSSGSFTPTYFTTGYEPDRAKISYRSGDYVLDSSGCYKMPNDLAKAVAEMATARLTRPLCTEGEFLLQKESELRADLTIINPDGLEVTRWVRQEVLKCPFGTRQGEVNAWEIVKSRKKLNNRADVFVGVI